ncbi:hypothetical protein [Bacillus cereus]|uniref:hypothetical protein n=1 Tax=Bacillus cereus TaxID=1396 RepID=UPI000B4BE716|nr:hypothetical protein [Bacillus cereus]
MSFELDENLEWINGGQGGVSAEIDFYINRKEKKFFKWETYCFSSAPEESTKPEMEEIKPDVSLFEDAAITITLEHYNKEGILVNSPYTVIQNIFFTFSDEEAKAVLHKAVSNIPEFFSALEKIYTDLMKEFNYQPLETEKTRLI